MKDDVRRLREGSVDEAIDVGLSVLSRELNALVREAHPKLCAAPPVRVRHTHSGNLVTVTVTDRTRRRRKALDLRLSVPELRETYTWFGVVSRVLWLTCRGLSAPSGYPLENYIQTYYRCRDAVDAMDGAWTEPEGEAGK